MVNLNEIITQIPVNSYVIVGCLILGYIIKKWLPTDNRIIPTVLPIIGAVAEACLEGPAITAIIGGALGGCIAVGLHQVFKQYIEGKDLAATNGNGSKAEEHENEVDER